MKICCRCGIEKELTEFHNANSVKATKDQRKAACRECRAIEAKLKGPAYSKKQRMLYPKRGLYQDAKKRAKKLNLPFTIKQDDIFIPTHCPVLGIPLFAGDGYLCDNSPSLDKVIPALGYTPENTCVISMKANRIKNSGTAEDHRKIVKYIESFDER